MKTSASRSLVRKTRSFSLDPDVLREVDRTKGQDSASERVNSLLKYALEMERKASLDQEASEFFAHAPDDREERRAFQKANLKTWTRP
ncbi:MAG TPA: hypothetical protein VLW48_01660 [Candidatus Bathyarchaeia archaeon]|nr:hypothetical protein [Candidatus Bathyarchaeia archaeon]